MPFDTEGMKKNNETAEKAVKSLEDKRKKKKTKEISFGEKIGGRAKKGIAKLRHRQALAAAGKFE